MESVGQFFFSVSAIEFADGVIKIRITLLEEQIVVISPPPTYPTFCHFRIDFNSFTPKIFASPLFLDSVFFSKISFASHVNEVWELALVAELMKSGK